MDDRIKSSINFINLHGHSTFSYFDGLGYPQDIYDFVYQNGMDACAITDHGNMNCLSYQFAVSKKMEKEGRKVKPIWGIEAYYLPSLIEWKKDYEEQRNKTKRIKSDEDNLNIFLEDEMAVKKGIRSVLNRRMHLLLLAKNKEGLYNLFKLVSESYKKENFFRYPRVDFEMLKRYHTGIIATSACLGGNFGYLYNRHKSKGPDEVIIKLREEAEKFLSLFGEDWYGELQWNSIPEQHIVNQYVIQLSQELGFKLISTSDFHYPRPELWKDREIYKRLGWLGKSGKNKPEWFSEELPKNVEEIGFELYPKNGDQIWESFLKTSQKSKSYYEEFLIKKSIEETHHIAFNKIEDFYPNTEIKLPNFVVPKGKKPESVLTRLCLNNMKEMRLDKKKNYVERLKKELYTIKDRGFSQYFLAMKAIVDKAKEVQLVGNSRGSAGGALTSYILGITQLDPIKWGLQFERFLTKTGEGYPDIDLDFSDPVSLKELFKKEWGEYSIVQISNFNTLQMKSLIKDVSKLYNIDWKEVNEVTSRMLFETVPQAKKDHGIESGIYAPTYEEFKKYSQTLKEYLKKYPIIDDHIKTLKGQIRSLGAHASGTLIAEKLNEVMPLIGVGGKIQTPWMEGVTNRHLEPLGFIKFDLLGLSSLKMIETCIYHVLKRRFNIENPTFSDVKKFYDEKLHPDKINFNNQNIWKNIFQEGAFLGIFQLTGKGAQEFCKRIKPTNIEELSDMTSVFRPGPLGSKVDEKYLAVKEGGLDVEYSYPIVKNILGKTKNQLIYQEQIAELAHELGKDISLDEGNLLRKLLVKTGLGKKTKEKEKIWKRFREGCQEKNISEEEVETLIKQIEMFAQYGFNKSHAVAYSIVSFQCAWLFYHYPLEWCAAFMQREPEIRKEKAISLVKSMGINIKPLDINTSGLEWQPEGDDTLISPLLSIKGLGIAAIEQIINNRPFNAIEDLLFSDKVVHAKLNKRWIDALFKAGAMNNLIDDRFVNSKHFWLSCISDKPRTKKLLRENIEKYKDTNDFTEEEKIEFIIATTGLFPIDKVYTSSLRKRLNANKIPPISEYDSEIGLVWCVPRRVEIKKTKTNKDYFQVDVIDNNFSLTQIRCWSINVREDKIYLNRPYKVRLNYSEQWGFSSNGPIKRNWALMA